MTSPCYKCPERRVGCHGKCERYKEFARMRRELCETAREDNDMKYLTWRPDHGGRYEGVRAAMKRRCKK